MSKRRFMQPLAVALVSLVFTLLFFSIARVDLRQLEGVIHDMLKQKAFFVVEGIEAASQIRYDRIMKSGATIDGFQPGLPAEDETFAIQETLVKALVDLARDVDTQTQKLPLIPDELKTLAASEYLHAVVILDNNRNVAFQSSPVSLQMSSQARDLVSGRLEAVVHLLMEQALLNIVRNAVDAISGEGAITLVLEIYKKDFIRIRVRDTGAGIAANETGRIFDPDYTTKSNGTGLGLSIAHEIVLAHGGEIRVQSIQGRETVFDILLPGLERGNEENRIVP